MQEVIAGEKGLILTPMKPEKKVKEKVTDKEEGVTVEEDFNELTPLMFAKQSSDVVLEEE